MSEQSLGKWSGTTCCDLQVALMVSNEIVRRGLSVMLDSMAAVRHVRDLTRATPGGGATSDPTGNENGAEWDRLLQAPWSNGAPFDVLILAFADLPAEVVEQLAGDVRRRGAKVVLLVSGRQEETLDLVATIPSDGFLIQEELTAETLTGTLSRIGNGEVPMPGVLANRLLSRARAGELQPRSRANTLTPRERQVLELLVEGRSNKQIAGQLHISQHGVKRLVSNVLAKLNCPNRTLAVAVALTGGFLAED